LEKAAKGVIRAVSINGEVDVARVNFTYADVFGWESQRPFPSAEFVDEAIGMFTQLWPALHTHTDRVHKDVRKEFDLLNKISRQTFGEAVAALVSADSKLRGKAIPKRIGVPGIDCTFNIKYVDNLLDREGN
jgi:hypothetical protein